MACTASRSPKNNRSTCDFFFNMGAVDVPAIGPCGGGIEGSTDSSLFRNAAHISHLMRVSPIRIRQCLFQLLSRQMTSFRMKVTAGFR